MINSEKNHETGLRILEILKILLEEDASKQNIMDKLKVNDVSSVYTNEAYLKYFNTLEALGLNIEKNYNCFCLKNALFYVDLTPSEEKILIKLIQSISKLNNKNIEETAENLILKIDKYVKLDLRKELKFLQNKIYDNSSEIIILNTLKQIMEDGSKVGITYKKCNKELTIDVIIKKIIEEKGHYYVICYNSGMLRSRRININSIISLKRSPKQAAKFEQDSTVIYEVYGRLAKSYKLKLWESIEAYEEGYTRVINKKEDLDTLMHRLLKYGENCKIIKPANIVQEFKSLTDDILKNLEENVCQQ